MEQNNVRVTVRVDKALKEAAEELFNHLGMNMTTALNVFLRKSVDEKSIPFAIGMTAKTSDGNLAVDEVTRAFEGAVQNVKTENLRKGFPIARYDAVSERAYLEYADGAREYVK